MRDWGTVIRKAYFDALRNAIVIEGATIPVFDEKMDTEKNDIFIKIGPQETRNMNTKCHFRAACTIQIWIVDRRKSTASKLKIDDVANQILTTLYPTKKTNILDVDPPYQLVASVFDTSDTVFGKTADGFETTKVLYFQNTINQS